MPVIPGRDENLRPYLSLRDIDDSGVLEFFLPFYFGGERARSPSVTQTDLELKVVPLPQLPECCG